MYADEFMFSSSATTLALLLLPVSSVAAQDLSGTWIVATERFQSAQPPFRVRLSQSGSQLSGTSTGNHRVVGTVRGERVTLELLRADGSALATLQGRRSGDSLRGEGAFPDPVTWWASRVSVRPAIPREHELEPKVFHNVIGTASPAVRVHPGDTVRTWSIDSAGKDSAGRTRASAGNPLTGPVFVEGAVNGDTLVVRFRRVRVMGMTGFSGTQVVERAITGSYLRGTKPMRYDALWNLDHAKGEARLAKPTERLQDLSIPIAAMVGCVGVAPQRNQAIATGRSGAHGGNMDYNRIREGTTVYLPVFMPGAMLYV